MKKLLSTLAIAFLLTVPSITHAGWLSDIFKSKKDSGTVIKQENKQSNTVNQGDTTIGDTTIGGTTVGGDTINLPDEQKSQLFDGNLFQTFSPQFTKQNELTEKSLDIFRNVLKNQQENNKSIIEKAGVITESAIKNSKENASAIIKSNKENNDTLTKPITDISNGIKLDQDTKTFIQSLRQDVVTPLNTFGIKFQSLIDTLSANNTALTNAITNMPFPVSGGTASNTQTFTQTAHGFVVGDELYISATNTFAKSDADSAITAEWIGTVSLVTDTNNFTLRFSGVYVTDKIGLTGAQIYYVSGTAGALTLTEPSAISAISKPVFIALNATSGFYHNFRGSPAQGQTAVIQYASSSGSSTVPVGAIDVDWTTPIGSIPNTGTLFTLTAGLSYRLEAMIGINYNTGSTASAFYQWVDSSNTSIGANIASGFNQVSGATGDSIAPITSFVYTPSVTTQVKVRILSSNASAGAFINRAYMSITQIGASPVPMSLAGEYGENNTITTGQTTSSATFVDVTNGTINITTAGTWVVGYNLNATQTSAGQGISAVITDAANAVVSGSVSNTSVTTNNANGITLLTQQVFITTTGAATYKLRWSTGGTGTATISNVSTSTGAGGGATSKTFWRKISGFTPISGQIVDYVSAYLNVTQSSNLGTGDHIKFDAVDTGNITLDTATAYTSALNVASIGRFTLLAGKTYSMMANTGQVNMSTGSDSEFAWFNADTGTIIGQSAMSLAVTNGTHAASNGTVQTVYTPSVNTRVELRITNNGGITNIGGTSGTSGGSTRPAYVNIVQIGSSNANTLSAFTGATSLVAGTSGIVPAPSIGGNSKVLLGSGVFGSSLVGIRVLTSGTSYVPTSGTNKIIAYVIGGGGGGGAVASSGSSFSGSGGGAGGVVGFSETVSDQTTYTYSIGAGGASSSNGVNTTIVVNSTTYTGGAGNSGIDGTIAAPSVTSGVSGGGTNPAAPTGNAFYATNGGPGSTAFSVASNNHGSGSGGSNMFGTGGVSQALNASGAITGQAGDGFGGGGGGALQNNSTARAGGAGAAGAIIIQEIR